MTKKLTPAQVLLILEWANRQLPRVNVELTNYNQTDGADGVLIEFDRLNIEQAMELFELRRQVECHASIGNSKNLDQVVFDMLFPNGKHMIY